VRWYWQLLAWFVAIPFAFGVVVLPSVALGLLTRRDLLDVFVGTGAGRYIRLGLVAFVWAFVAAVVVHASVEIGRLRMTRRRACRDGERTELKRCSVTG
jgi:hypothetical protein